MRILLFWLFIILPFQLSAQNKISLKQEMIMNITGWGDATLLVDEQDLAGDPLSGKGNRVFNRWNPGWSDWYYPSSAIIDLQAEYQISDIYFYDGAGTGHVSVHAGTPGNWKLLFDSKLDQYLTWKRHGITNTKARFIQITINKLGAAPEEVLIYGKKTGDDISVPIATNHPAPVMKDFIGINAFVDDPLEVSRVVNFIREYHNWGWNEKLQDKLRFSPSSPGWDFDNYYKKMKEAGITVVPCLKESPSWIAAEREHKPVLAGLDTEDPRSYKEKAGFMFQYAARYGSKVVDKSLLKLDQGQPAKTGLNYIKYYEDWNEQDKWWLGRKAYFTPYEYAAMASANYDGHKGALGPGYGIKTADPAAVLVMGGLTGLNLEYVKGVKLWADYHRGGEFPADVINFHPYSNNAGGQKGSATTGISPEEDDLKNKLKAIVDYRNRYLPGKEVWVTEFGYDINQASPQRAPVIGTFTAEEVQGMWLVRSYLEMAAAGVDRAAMYMIRDAADVTATGKYGTSGLIEGKNGRKKQSWYYVKTLNNILGNFRFEKEISAGKVNNYKFSDEKTGKTIYMIWSPGSKQTVVKDYSFTLQEGSRNYALIGLKNLDEDGDTLQVSKSPLNSVKFIVTEKPVFLVVEAALPVVENPKEPLAKFSASSTQLCLGSSVTFTDQSTGANSWTWEFGDGATPATAKGKGPHKVKYSKIGNKTVSLTVSGEGGTSTSGQKDLVKVSGTPAAPLIENVEVCEGMAIPPLTAKGEHIRWFSDEGLKSEIGRGNTFAHGLTAPGIYKFHAVSDNGDGCTSRSSTAQLTINSAPVASVDGLNDTAYTLDDIEISLSGNPAGGIFQGPGINGNVLRIKDAGAGEHQLNYTFTSQNGCSVLVSASYKIYVGTDVEDALQESVVGVHPNPAQNNATLRYSLSKESAVKASIFNTYGNETELFKLQTQKAGDHLLILDKEGLNLAPGLYLLKICINKEVKTIKLIFN